MGVSFLSKQGGERGKAGRQGRVGVFLSVDRETARTPSLSRSLLTEIRVGKSVWADWDERADRKGSAWVVGFLCQTGHIERQTERERETERERGRRDGQRRTGRWIWADREMMMVAGSVDVGGCARRGTRAGDPGDDQRGGAAARRMWVVGQQSLRQPLTGDAVVLPRQPRPLHDAVSLHHQNQSHTHTHNATTRTTSESGASGLT